MQKNVNVSHPLTDILYNNTSRVNGFMRTTVREDNDMGIIENGMSATAAYASKTQKTEQTKGAKSYGRTIGEPKLSDSASKYYEQLKAKYSDYEFVLVSSDQEEQAMANAAQYAKEGKTVVLIDEEHVERMASDETYRKENEDILTGAKDQLEQLAESLKDTAGVKGYGIQIKSDGTTSFFAAIDKNAAELSQKQQERIEKKAEQKKETARTEKKERQQEQLEELRDQKRTDRKEQPEEIEVVTASGVEELLQKIRDLNYAWMSDRVMTDAERAVGGTIDLIC